MWTEIRKEEMYRYISMVLLLLKKISNSHYVNFKLDMSLEWNNCISEATKGHSGLKFLKQGLFLFGTRKEKIGVKKYTGKETSQIIAIIVVASEGCVFVKMC